MIKLIIFRNGRRTVMCMAQPFAVGMANICMNRGETVIFRKRRNR